MPEDKEAFGKKRQNRLAGGMREEARRFLRAFTSAFPLTHARRRPVAGRAVFRQDLKTAWRWRVRLSVPFLASPEVPEAMWQLGESCGDETAPTRRPSSSTVEARIPVPPGPPQVKEALARTPEDRQEQGSLYELISLQPLLPACSISPCVASRARWPLGPS